MDGFLVIAFDSTEQTYLNFPSPTAQPIQAFLQGAFQANPTMQCTLNAPALINN